MDINNAGRVVGLSRVPAGDYHAFIWDSEDGMRDLGTLGGRHSAAYAISENGIVVGEAAVSTGDPHAFIWTAESGMRDLGTLPQGQYSRARGVNDAGMVVGSSVVGPGCCVEHAFVWDASGGMRDLGTLDGDYSEGWAINNAGTVIGWRADGDAISVRRAFVWSPTKGMEDLGSLGWPGVWASAINQAGYVTGWANVSSVGPNVAFIRGPDGVLRSFLGILTAGRGLNEQHQVVGEAWHPPAGGSHAYIWDPEVGQHWLGEAGGDSHASAVNDQGTVTGWVALPDGTSHAVTWATRNAFDSASLSVSGAHTYTASGALQSGDLQVQRSTSGRVSQVTGTGTVGTATVGFNVRQFWILPVMVGSVTLNDPGAAMRLSTPIVFSRAISGQDGSAGGVQGWIDFSRFPWKPYTLRWSVTDRV